MTVRHHFCPQASYRLMDRLLTGYSTIYGWCSSGGEPGGQPKRFREIFLQETTELKEEAVSHSFPFMRAHSIWQQIRLVFNKYLLKK